MGCCGSREAPEEITRKIAVLGNNRVGKTCLIQRFVKDEFLDDTPNAYIPSALQMDEKVVQLKNGKKVHLCIYDLGGQDTFRHLRKMNYPKSDAAIICFSIDDKASLAAVKENWVPDMQRICPGIPMVLAGLKRDARDNAETIDNFVRESHGHSMAKKNNMVAYCECSAWSGDGVQEVFQKLAIASAKKKNTAAKVNDAEFSGL